MTSHALRSAFFTMILGLLAAGCDGDPAGVGAEPDTAGAPEAVGANAGRRVASSGKQDAALATVPGEVLAAARSSRPELTVEAAEYETRDGREYYDVAGNLPDGSELELDLTRIDGVWTVVEVQRDVTLDTVPEPVRAALPKGWAPGRIIESDQGDGVVIYEFFGPDKEGEEIKVEVKWAGGTALVLEDEWVH